MDIRINGNFNQVWRGYITFMGGCEKAYNFELGKNYMVKSEGDEIFSISPAKNGVKLSKSTLTGESQLEITNDSIARTFKKNRGEYNLWQSSVKGEETKYFFALSERSLLMQDRVPVVSDKPLIKPRTNLKDVASKHTEEIGDIKARFKTTEDVKADTPTTEINVKKKNIIINTPNNKVKTVTIEPEIKRYKNALRICETGTYKIYVQLSKEILRAMKESEDETAVPLLINRNANRLILERKDVSAKDNPYVIRVNHSSHCWFTNSKTDVNRIEQFKKFHGVYDVCEENGVFYADLDSRQEVKEIEKEPFETLKGAVTIKNSESFLVVIRMAKEARDIFAKKNKPSVPIKFEFSQKKRRVYIKPTSDKESSEPNVVTYNTSSNMVGTSNSKEKEAYFEKFFGTYDLCEEDGSYYLDLDSREEVELVAQRVKVEKSVVKEKVERPLDFEDKRALQTENFEEEANVEIAPAVTTASSETEMDVYVISEELKKKLQTKLLRKGEKEKAKALAKGLNLVLEKYGEISSNAIDSIIDELLLNDEDEALDMIQSALNIIDEAKTNGDI